MLQRETQGIRCRRRGGRLACIDVRVDEVEDLSPRRGRPGQDFCEYGKWTFLQEGQLLVTGYSHVVFGMKGVGSRWVIRAGGAWYTVTWRALVVHEDGQTVWGTHGACVLRPRCVLRLWQVKTLVNQEDTYIAITPPSLYDGGCLGISHLPIQLSGVLAYILSETSCSMLKNSELCRCSFRILVAPNYL